ncbi:unnamed protein product, partial [Didymodactylos carnosus]
MVTSSAIKRKTNFMLFKRNKTRGPTGQAEHWNYSPHRASFNRRPTSSAFGASTGGTLVHFTDPT